MLKTYLLLFTFCIHSVYNDQNIPVVITTWRFENASVKGELCANIYVKK